MKPDWLGASEQDERDNFVIVFVPSVTRDGIDIDHDAWVERVVRELSSVFGGATAVEGFGGWSDVERDNRVVTERVRN